MKDSWSTIYTTLKRAKVVLEEILEVMPDTNEDQSDTRTGVKNTYQSVNELITSKDQEIKNLASAIEYQELVKKLKAQNLSFTPEEWDDA